MTEHGSSINIFSCITLIHLTNIIKEQSVLVSISEGVAGWVGGKVGSGRWLWDSGGRMDVGTEGAVEGGSNEVDRKWLATSQPYKNEGEKPKFCCK